MADNRQQILDLEIDKTTIANRPIKEVALDLLKEKGIDIDDYINVQYLYEPFKSSETNAHIIITGVPSTKNKFKSYQSSLDELKKIRESLNVFETVDEQKRNFQEVLAMVESLEEKVGLANEISPEFSGELNEIDRRLDLIKELHDTKMKEFEKNCALMNSIFEEEEEAFNSEKLFDADELESLRRAFAKEKLIVASEIGAVKQEMSAINKFMNILKKKRNEIERNLHSAIALGLTVAEYQSIQSSLRKRTIMNSIYESKGLESIVSKKAKDRTKEEKELLKETKNEIMVAIAEEMKKSNKSVLDSIELLYHVDTAFYKKQEARTISFSEQELNNISKSISSSPVQIKGVKNTGYIPGKKPEDLENHEIIIYNDFQNEVLYVKEDDLNWLGIKFDASLTKDIYDNNCCQISNQIAFNIISNKDNKEKPYIVRSVSLQDEKQENNYRKPSVDAIINKIIKDINIDSKDSNSYTASNLKPTKEFLDELKTGNYLYNIVHVGVGLIKASVSLLKKISEKLLLSEKAKDAILEIQRRLDDLSKEEIEVLFNEYKSSVIKTDMNNQIDALIIDKLKRYGLEQVEDLNGKIKIAYSSLFTLLGEIKVLEEKLASNDLNPEEESNYKNEKNKYLAAAADHIKVILKARRDANNILSSDIPGLEDHYNAISSKLNYVDMVFAKNSSFDEEKKAKVSEYNQKINDAIESFDNESLVENFMGLEVVYYNNKVDDNLANEHSVGIKYYSPLAEQFNYRDDPFISDFLTTLTLTSANVSAYNANQIHKIEGENVEGGETSQSFENNDFGEELEGQDFFNSFQDSVINQMNDISSRYSSEEIDQVEALDEIVSVANNSQATFTDVCHSALETIKDNLTEKDVEISKIEKTLHDLADNPTDVAEKDLQELPADIEIIVVCAAFATALATKVAHTLDNKYHMQAAYDNYNLGQVSDYLFDIKQSDEEKKEHIK